MNKHMEWPELPKREIIKDGFNRPNTEVYIERGLTKVKLYQTVIVSWDSEKIHINSGRHNTVTTRRRMNEASKHYALGFRVSSKKGQLVVTYKEVTHTDEDNFITLVR